MKRVSVFCFSLLLSGALALAQNEKVVTPHTVNPSGEPAVVVDADPAVVSQPSTGRKWYFGIGGGVDYSTKGWTSRWDTDTIELGIFFNL